MLVTRYSGIDIAGVSDDTHSVFIYIYIYIYILAFEYNTGTADITHNTCTQLHMTNRPRGLRFCVALGLPGQSLGSPYVYSR